MGFKYDYELEVDLLSVLSSERIFATDYYGRVHLDFDDSWDKFQNFLNSLAAKQFINFNMLGSNYIICPGPKVQEWRLALSKKLPKESGHVTNQTNFNITATNVNAAGGDMTVTINGTDLEHLVALLKYTIDTHPEKDKRFAKVKEILDSGNNIIEIIKNISSIFA